MSIDLNKYRFNCDLVPHQTKYGIMYLPGFKFMPSGDGILFSVVKDYLAEDIKTGLKTVLKPETKKIKYPIKLMVSYEEEEYF